MKSIAGDLFDSSSPPTLRLNDDRQYQTSAHLCTVVDIINNGDHTIPSLMCGVHVTRNVPILRFGAPCPVDLIPITTRPLPNGGIDVDNVF